MTLPSDYNSNTKVVGDSLLKPVYVFSVNISRLTNEEVGVKTNSSSVNVFHPDMSNQSGDYGRTLLDGHNSVAISSWLPGFLKGNVVINGNGTITAYGQHAIYLKKNYVDVPNAILTITNRPPYVSTDMSAVTHNIPKSGGSIRGAGTATVLFIDN